MKVITFHNPTVSDIESGVKELWKLMSEGLYPRQRITVQFTEPVEVQVNRRNRKTVKEMTVKFFQSSAERLCYTFYRSSGYPLSYFGWVRNIKSIAISEKVKDEEAEKLKKVMGLLNRIHPNAWPELKAKPDRLKDYSLHEMNITKHFPRYVIEAVADAFENKKDYSYHTEGKRRHWRVSVRVGEDGYVRAWFSSEYTDCANGNYYLLLNETMASFGEVD